MDSRFQAAFTDTLSREISSGFLSPDDGDKLERRVKSTSFCGIRVVIIAKREMVTKKPPPGSKEEDKLPKAKQKEQQQEADPNKQADSTPSSPSRKRHKHKHHHSHKHRHAHKHHQDHEQKDPNEKVESSLPSKNDKPPPPSPQQTDEHPKDTEGPIDGAERKDGDKKSVSVDSGVVASQDDTQKESISSEPPGASKSTPSLPQDGVEKGTNDYIRQSEEDNDNDSKPHASSPVQRRQHEESHYDDNDYHRGDAGDNEHDNNDDVDDNDFTFDVEHLIRLETSRQLEAAWSAQRRLVGAFISKIRQDKNQLVDQQ